MQWRRNIGLTLAALGAAALGVGFLTGYATAPHREARAPIAAAPAPSATAVVTPSPAVTASPPPAVTPVPAASTATPPPPPADASPAGAVADFYQLVGQHQFDEAIRLWSPHMQASYPPAENIYQRFADTTSLNLLRDETSEASDGAAVVAIDLVEVRAGRTYHWLGNWYLVRRESTWLLDQPGLRPG